MKHLIRITALLLMTVVAQAKDLYVSPLGNDAWTGSLADPKADQTDGPLRSPQKALESSRVLRKADPSTPIRILFQTGTYRLPNPLVIYVADSGLSMEALPGAAVTLTGGRTLEKWKKSGDLWEAPVPEDWTFRWLSVNGTPRQRARLPKTGFFTHDSRFDVQWKSTTGGEWGRPLTREETTLMKYREGDLGPWLDLASAEVEVEHMWDESWTGVSALDAAARTLTFTLPTTHPPGAFDVHDYAVWNVKEGLTDPGLWCLDRTHHRVLYRPLPGENPAGENIQASGPDQLIRFSGYSDLPVSQVTLKGLSLTLADAPLSAPGFGAMNVTAAIQMAHTRGCVLVSVSVSDSAGWAVQGSDVSETVLSHCAFFDLGAGGARLQGKDNRLADSVFKNLGLMYRSSIGVYWEGSGGVLSHNELEDMPYDGIMNNASDALIEGNRIRRVMLQLHDGAAIYSGFSKNVTLRGNAVSDVPDTGGYGSSAYYLDEQAQDCLVEDNLSVGVARPSQNHMAKDNTLRGNLFVVSGDGRLCFARCEGYRVEDNVLYASGAWSFEAPEEGVTDWPDNLIFSGSGRVEWKKLSVYATVGVSPWEAKDGSRLTDPLLADPEKGDFSLRKNSPAAKLLKGSWKTAGPRSSGASMKTP